MDARRGITPFLHQLRGDPYGLGRAAQSSRSEHLTPRTRTADKVVQSMCPDCAVGCGQKVYVKDEKVIQIGGDPDSPISRGRVCPKGSASDPRHVVGPQCAMIERRERSGAARRWSRITALRPDKGSPATAPVELSAS